MGLNSRQVRSGGLDKKNTIGVWELNTAPNQTQRVY